MDVYRPKLFRAVEIPGDSPARKLLGKTKSLPVGFHFVIDRASLEPVPDVFDFLLAEHVSQLGKPRLRHQENTSKSNAEDLIDLLLYANSVRTPLSDFTEEALQDYADTMSETISPQTGKVYSSATIIKRVSTAKRALEYLQNQGRLKNRIETRSVVTNGEERLVFASNVVLPSAPAVDALVRHISPDLIGEIGDILGPMPSQGDAAPSRDRLVFVTLCNTGARVSEALSCNCADLPVQLLRKKDPLTACYLKVKAKGGGRRNVRLPIWLLRELDLYVRNERLQATAHLTDDEAHDRLFVNHGHDRGNAGLPFSAKNFRKILRRAALEAASKLGSSSIPSPHSCRHSFALINYAVERLNGNPDPGKAVQALLGHKQKATTEKIYLDASIVLEEALSEADQKKILQYLKERGL